MKHNQFVYDIKSKECFPVKPTMTPSLKNAVRIIMETFLDLALVPMATLGFEYTREHGQSVVWVSIRGYKGTPHTERYCASKLFVPDVDNKGNEEWKNFALSLYNHWESIK